MSEVKDGVVRGLGVGLGYLPVAMRFGTLAPLSGLSWSEALGMSASVYAAAAQFIALDGLRQGLRGPASSQPCCS